ncbi:hypothetical protein DFS34DRAFT_166162 [Phlyctochytrium arcticum]|nr:hypothetical protein DFS34DRAFT_166162 [Phlyctochytrium arcticum]
MLYLLGVNLPDEKVVSIALTKIYGVGSVTGSRICDQLGIHPRCRLKDLPEAKVTQLSALLNTMQIDVDLRREVRNRVQGMIAMGSYRGNRHKSGLPVNGQRTHTNRQTAKRLNGKWLRVGAGAQNFSTSPSSCASSPSIPRPPCPPRSIFQLLSPVISLVKKIR